MMTTFSFVFLRYDVMFLINPFSMLFLLVLSFYLYSKVSKYTCQVKTYIKHKKREKFFLSLFLYIYLYLYLYLWCTNVQHLYDVSFYIVTATMIIAVARVMTLPVSMVFWSRNLFKVLSVSSKNASKI